MKLFHLTVLIHFMTAVGGAAISPSVQESQADSPSTKSTATDSVSQWLIENSVPIDAWAADASFTSVFDSARVIGLGEATHGQRECFAFKRQLTLSLIKEHGFRLVAYEANASRAKLLNDYVQGSSDDIAVAMGGFGMMIWMVEENRMLLDELRSWNAKAEAGDRVEIIGIDVQDASEAAQGLQKLLEGALPELALEAVAIADQLMQARNAAYGRELEGIEPAQRRLAAFLAELSQRSGEIALRTSRENADEVMRCARELARFPVDPTKPAMRERGMSQSLLDGLATRPAGTKAVLWGHNGHITRGPMRWMGTTETACGGFLRAALGDEYYALGVAFGSGGFQALHRDEENKWWFRRYEHGPPPVDTVGQVLTTAGLSDVLIDFRHAPKSGPVREWLDRDCGIRSWGGHGVPVDPDAAVDQGLGLAWTILSADYDGLLFIKQTTSAEPVNPDRIWN